MAQTAMKLMLGALTLKERMFGPKNSPLSPEARAVRSLMRTLVGSVASSPLDKVRERANFAASLPVPPEFSVRDLDCSGSRAVYCERKGLPADAPVVLFFHGGGYVLGSPDSSRGNLLPLFVDYNAHICFGQYALCPEKTPVDALQNGLDIYRYLLTVMNIAPQRICVIGESAGGNVAFNMALKLRSLGLPQPGCWIGWSALLDFTASTKSPELNAETDILTPALVGMFVQHFPKDMDRVALSPLVHDPAGLAPVFLSAGGAERLIDENRQFYEKCKAAGVVAELEAPEGMFHGFQGQHSCPESRRAIQVTKEWMQRHCTAASSSSP